MHFLSYALLQRISHHPQIAAFKIPGKEQKKLRNLAFRLNGLQIRTCHLATLFNEYVFTLLNSSF